MMLDSKPSDAARGGRAEAPVLSSKLGVRLKLARQTKGMTLKSLAEAAGCSESLLPRSKTARPRRRCRCCIG